MSNARLFRSGLKIMFLFAFLAMSLAVANGQTSQFSFQGTLNSGGSPANGNYDLEFRLYDSVAGGSQVGSTITRSAFPVVNGGFSVVLDFQAAAFPGSDRYLEISVRPAASGSFTTLSPRSQMLSVPYSITAATAVTATTAATAATATTAGTATTALNATTADTATTAINATTADTANTATTATTAATATNSLNLGGVPAAQFVLSGDARLSDARVPTAGSPSYIQNNSGSPQASASLSIDGTAAATNINALQNYLLNGQRIMSVQGSAGQESIFVGPDIALNNSGPNNTFFGTNTGTLNTTGGGNSFFGRNAGAHNLGGNSNTFIGTGAGAGNETGSFNVIIGQTAGIANASGQSNTFVGATAGASSTTGSNNVGLGASAGNGPALGSNNTFIGQGAIPNQPNLSFATAIGSGAVVSSSNTIVIGRSLDTTVFRGPLQVNGGVGGASIPVCASNIGQLGVCASSKRYKSDIATYRGGLNVINQLRPVTFTWTEDKIKDVGFVAEELNAVEPRLSIRNKEGVVEGIKYGQITAVIVNAMKEQQAQIAKLQAEFDALKTRVRPSRNRPRSHK